MTVERNNTELTSQQKTLLMFLYVSGVAFLIAGAFVFMKPDAVQNFMNMDASTTKALGVGLLFIAFNDLTILPIFIKNAAKKASKND